MGGRSGSHRTDCIGGFDRLDDANDVPSGLDKLTNAVNGEPLPSGKNLAGYRCEFRSFNCYPSSDVPR